MLETTGSEGVPQPGTRCPEVMTKSCALLPHEHVHLAVSLRFYDVLGAAV